jgi:hypothetical protein
MQAGADSRLKETVFAPEVVYAGWAFRKLMLPLRRGAAVIGRPRPLLGGIHGTEENDTEGDQTEDVPVMRSRPPCE